MSSWSICTSGCILLLTHFCGGEFTIIIFHKCQISIQKSIYLPIAIKSDLNSIFNIIILSHLSPCVCAQAPHLLKIGHRLTEQTWVNLVISCYLSKYWDGDFKFKISDSGNIIKLYSELPWKNSPKRGYFQCIIQH